MSKGSRARPLSVPLQTFGNNFDAIFRKPDPRIVEEQKIEKQVVEVAEEVAAATPFPPKEETSEDPALKDAEANKWWEDKKKMEEEASMHEEDKKKMMAVSLGSSFMFVDLTQHSNQVMYAYIMNSTPIIICFYQKSRLRFNVAGSR